MPSFPTPAPIRTILDIPAGRVRFTATERTDTTVEVAPADGSKRRDVQAAEETAVDYADGVLRIRTETGGNQYFGPSGSVAVTVHLPAGSGVEARTGSCELHVSGRLGDVAFDGAHRRISIEEVASLRLTAVDGDVEVGRLGGPAEISTARGDIRITEAVRGKVVLRTDSGGITVGAAPGVSASLDANTPNGRISNSLRNADGAGAPLAVHATTSNGDVVASSPPAV